MCRNPITDPAGGSSTFGVTTVLDMFSKPDPVAGAKEQAGSRPDVWLYWTAC